MTRTVLETEEKRLFERPDESAVLTSANSVLSRYPRYVQRCNDLLRAELGVFTPAKYAWVHGPDIYEVVHTETSSFRKVLRLGNFTGYCLCLVQPMTRSLHALRSEHGHKHGHDFMPVYVNHRQYMTQPNQENLQSLLFLTWQALTFIRESDRLYKLAGGAHAYMMRDSHRSKAAAAVAERARNAVIYSLNPESQDGSVSKLATVNPEVMGRAIDSITIPKTQ